VSAVDVVVVSGGGAIVTVVVVVLTARVDVVVAAGTVVVTVTVDVAVPPPPPDEEELLVSFTVDNIDKAINVLKNKSAEVLQSVAGNVINLHISKEDIPKFNLHFMENEIQVFAIESKRKLEDYFLKLINN
jgi:hypothetical protein